MFDIVALGDTMIDFTPVQLDGAESLVYETNVGGTIANFAASCSKMGMSSLVVSRVGQDSFGKLCESTLKGRGVNTSGISFDEKAFTTLSFVTLNAGERSFIFSRRHAADINLSKEHFDQELALNTKVLHVSGMSFSDEPCRATAFSMIRDAKSRGIIVTLDVNYREQLWESSVVFCQVMREVLREVCVVKGSEEEIFLLTGFSDYNRAAEEILNLGADLVVVSAGPRGAFYKTQDISGCQNTYDTKRVDTTGAGDCFMGGLVYSFIKNINEGKPYLQDIEHSIDFANAAGAVSISVRGGVASAPTIEEIKFCQSNEKRLVMSW